MSAALTRRALALAGAAALGSAVAPIADSAVPMPPCNPDVGLFDLFRRHGEARAAMEQAWAAFEAASARFLSAAPPRPDGLLWRDGDFPRTALGTGLSVREDDDVRWYGEKAAGWLRGRKAATRFLTVSPPLGPECEARRLEILAAWDRWQAERQAIEDATGYTAAGEISDAAAQLVVDLAVEIKMARPRTLPGLRALGTWFGRQVENDELHDDFLEQLAAAVAGFVGVAT